MTTFDAGTAAGKLTLDTSQYLRALKDAQAQSRALFAQIKAGGAGGALSASPDIKGIDAAQARAAKSAAQVATEQQRAALVAGKLATEEQRAALILANTEKAQTNAARSALALQQAQARAAKVTTDPVLPRSLERFGGEALDQLKSGLLGIVGPAALVTAGLGLVIRTAGELKEAFLFNAELQATNAAITAQISKIRDAGIAFREAQAFGARFRLTQSEITSTLQASVAVMRLSNASTTDLLNSLARLQSLAPDKPISEAARALRELATGDVTTIKEVFNVGAKDALAMKNEIAGGADAVKVLTRFLDDSQIGMEGLEAKTRGAAGAIQELERQTERLKIATGGGTEAAGEQVTRTFAAAKQLAAALISGDFRDIQAQQAANTAGQDAYNKALAEGKTRLEASAIAQQAQTQAAQEYVAWVGAAGEAERNRGGVLSQTTQEINLQSQAMIQASAALAEARDATATYNAALGENAGAQAISAAQSEILKTRQEGIRDTLAQLSAGTLGQTQAEGILATQYGVTAAQIPQLIDLTNQLAASRAAASAAQGLEDQRAGERNTNVRTKAEADSLGRLNALRGEYARRRAADNERAAAEAERIATRQISAGARVRTQQVDQNRLATEQLRTQEQIADEIERANQARLDAAIGINNDAIADLKAAREKAGLERALRSGHFSDEQHQSQMLRIQQLNLENSKREADIARDLKTAGVVSGGPTATGPAIPVGASAPVFAPALPGVGAAPQINIPITINIDDQGRATITGAPAGVNLNVLINKGLSRASG